jgi:NMD protein affecting ribosome stability and mRNA decay
MRVKPKLNYQLLGTDIKLNCKKVYRATIASNIPNYKKQGFIFVSGVLLDKTEYTIVK